MNKQVRCVLKEAISEKSGKPYKYLSIMLTDSLEKRVFLTQAEIEVINLSK